MGRIDACTRHVARPHSTRRGVLLLSLVCTLVAGCGHYNRVENKKTDQEVNATAKFYWPYAALAADVYRTGGQIRTELALALSSSWLRNEVSSTANGEVRKEYEDLLQPPNARQIALERANGPCVQETPQLIYTSAGADSNQAVAEVNCATIAAAKPNPDGTAAAGDTVSQPRFGASISRLIARPEVQSKAPPKAVPEGPDDCAYDGKTEPYVPVHLAIEEHGWEAVPELRRQLHPRAWSIFVPGLAIDVWRRKLSSTHGSPTVEYALIYRGTVDGGGWLSNLRAFTAFTPFIWDQYRQARDATKDLIVQLNNLHGLSDALFKRTQPTEIRITAVGHSLGAGLAKYVFLRVPEITRVVGFDPSPVDGSSSFSPSKIADERAGQPEKFPDRDSVLNGPTKRTIDHDPRDPKAAMYLLYEEGEALTLVAGCQSGPLWGDEGGPIVRCESVDLSGGNRIRQHNMPQLACKLYLATQNKHVRAKE